MSRMSHTSRYLCAINLLLTLGLLAALFAPQTTRGTPSESTAPTIETSTGHTKDLIPGGMRVHAANQPDVASTAVEAPQAMPIALATSSLTSTVFPIVTVPPALSEAPDPPSAPHSNIIWSADFETGDYSQWVENENGGIYNSGTGTATVTTAVARSGRYAGALTITGANNPGGDAQAVRVFRWKESVTGQALYYSAWYYFPQVYRPDSWWNVFQFKSRTPSRNDPFWALNVGYNWNNQMVFYLYDWPNQKVYTQDLMTIPVGRWFHVEVFYKQGINNGHITVWQDGVQLFDIDGITTMYPDSFHSALWSINNYTDAISPSDATIYIDDAVISTTRVGP